MKSPQLQELLADCALIRRFFLYASIDSTQNQARRLLTGVNSQHHNGTLLIADSQTAGRGRHGRAWLSPPSVSVLVTLIIHLDELPEYRNPSQLSLLAAAIPVAVARGISIYVPTVKIKFPNDIVADGRKLGGILLETYNGALLVGFGINCLQEISTIPPDARIPASSVFLETGKRFDREIILQSILLEMERILKPENFECATSEINTLCETLGRTICVDTGDEIITGIAQRIDNAGRLILETGSGSRSIISSQVIRTWLADGAEEGCAAS